MGNTRRHMAAGAHQRPFVPGQFGSPLRAWPLFEAARFSSLSPLLPRTQVAIIGAGPYGLSLGAHLKDRKVDFRIFGQPMEPWSRMHKGMGLKSPDFGTNVYSPRSGFRFVDWCRDRGISTQ